MTSIALDDDLPPQPETPAARPDDFESGEVFTPIDETSPVYLAAVERAREHYRQNPAGLEAAARFRDFHARGYCLHREDGLAGQLGSVVHEHSTCPEPTGGQAWLKTVDLERLAAYLNRKLVEHAGAFPINWDELRSFLAQGV